MSSSRVGALPPSLRSEIDACGYFPELIADAISLAVAGEEIVDHLVHHEATFARDEIQRHLSVLVLTPHRFIVCHTDEGENPQQNQALTTTESVPIGKLNSVALTQVVAHPERHGSRRSSRAETWLTVSWGTMRRLDLEPAGCADPQCEADHGYTGTLAGDDLTVRISAAADGADKVARLVAFASTLQVASGGGR